MAGGNAEGAPAPQSGPPDAPGGAEGDATKTFSLGIELARLQADNLKLDGARRELLEALDLRTRRVNQLLGERDQLERQLVRAEKSLQRLSRELGAARPPARSAPAAGLWSRLRALGERLQAGLDRFSTRRARPAAGPSVTPEVAASPDRAGPLVPLASDGHRRPVMAVVACGLAAEERESVLDMVARHGAAGNLMPLVLTDDDDFAPLRSRSMLFEYFPAPSVRAGLAPALEWDLYLQRRLALIRRKWRPVRVIAFGRVSADLVRLWSESPFEDPALGRLPTAERPAGPPPGSTANGPTPGP